MLAIVVIFGLLLIGLFYWFFIRPEQKLRECFLDANNSYQKSWKEWDENGDGKLSQHKANRLDKRLKENADRCVRIWK